MKYIVTIKDKKNEISLEFSETYEVTSFIKTVLEKSCYTIEIINVTED